MERNPVQISQLPHVSFAALAMTVLAACSDGGLLENCKDACEQDQCGGGGAVSDVDACEQQEGQAAVLHINRRPTLTTVPRPKR